MDANDMTVIRSKNLTAIPGDDSSDHWLPAALLFSRGVNRFKQAIRAIRMLRNLGRNKVWRCPPAKLNFA